MQIHDSLPDHYSASTTAEYEEMTIDEIFNGSKSNFPGLLDFVEKYVELKSPDQQTRDKLSKYIDFIRGKTQGLLFCILHRWSNRVVGTYMTTATWIRNFVRSHPSYQCNSVINEETCYDLMMTIDQM